ncbi:MAG: hypothetical protein HDR02_01415 [Lachnospiraceae bacterium]|nr:hypothetical protein [Lachnospiraceae bacterium]
MREFLRKHKWLLGIELACMALCLTACFRPEETVFSVETEEIADMLQTGEGSSCYRSDNMTLPPGVYILSVMCKDHQDSLSVDVQAQESSYQALRSNGGTVYAHQLEANLELYVTEKVDKAYVICNHIDETQQPIERIVLRRTSAGWRMLLFLLLLATVGLNLLIRFREGILDGSVGRDQEIVFWTLSASVLLAYLPYAVDYFYVGDEGWLWLLRIEGLKETLLQGNPFPVRVQEYWLYGNSYTVSAFCGDLFLLFPALLRMIGFSLMDAYKFFVAAVLAGTALISYHCFYRCTGSRYGALAGSALYELAPYHIYCLYNRSALQECLVMMFLPLVVLGIYRMYTADVESASYGRAKIPLVVGIGCILQSHVPGCLATIAGVATVCLIMWRKTLRRETLLELVKAALWCLALNAWFWARLLQMQWADQYVLSTTTAQSISQGRMGLAGLLQMYPYAGNGQPIQAGAAFWAVFLGYVVLRLGRREKKVIPVNPWDRIVSGSLLLCLLSLFLSTRYFPWDLSAAAELFSALAAAFFAVWLTEERKRWSGQTGSTVTACCAGCIAAAALLSVLFQVDELAWNSSPVRLYTAESICSVQKDLINVSYQSFSLSWCGELVSWGALAALILRWVLRRYAVQKEA